MIDQHSATARGADPDGSREFGDVDSPPTGVLVDAVITADDRGRIIAFNPSAERIFGWSAKEAWGQPLTALMPVRYRKAHTAGIRQFLTTGEAKLIGSTIELEGLRHDGEEFPVELSLSAWSNDGRTNFTAVVRVLRERRRAEDQFRALLDSAPDAIVVAGEDGRIVLVNRQVGVALPRERRRRAAAAAAEGQPVAQLVDRKRQPATRRA